MEITIKVPKSSAPFPIFRDRLFGGLSFLQQYGEDPSIAFLPKQGCARSQDKPPLLEMSDFPQVQCNMRLYYFSFPNPYSFYSVKNEKGKKIVFSTWMGFNVDPESYLSEMMGDLDERHCLFEIKSIQALELENAVVFWGAPQHMCKKDAKLIIDKHLQAVETEMMLLDPTQFPAEVHEQPWPKYSLVLEQPVSFNKYQPGAWSPHPPERAALHLKCIKSDTARFVKLVAVAKSKRIWLDEFGKCFPSEVVTQDAVEADREAYESILNGHMAVMHSYGKLYVQGLLKARSYFQVEKLPDAEGVIVNHSICVRDILQDIEFGGKKVFQCVLRSDGNSRYQVYFKARCPATCAYVREFLKCPAAQITCYLTKRGVTKKSATAFAKKCFDHNQLLKVVNAKYNSALRLAYVKSDEIDMDIGMAAREDDFIDRFGHLTEQQIAKEMAKEDPGNFDPAVYDFEGGQSVTSIHPGAAGPQRGSGISIGKSVFSLASEAASDYQIPDTADGTTEELPDSSRTVSFAMVHEDGTETPGLFLPDRGEVTEELRSCSDSDHHTDLGTADYALWVAAGEDPITVEKILDQLEAEISCGMDGVEIESEVASLITDDIRVRLRLDAQRAEESELRYIDQLRSALQEKFGLHSEEYENLSLSSDRDDERDHTSLTPPGCFEGTGFPQGSSNQALSSGMDPATSAAMYSADGSQFYGTAQTGGNPV